jgi:aldose sugar dehydrogenase
VIRLTNPHLLAIMVLATATGCSDDGRGGGSREHRPLSIGAERTEQSREDVLTGLDTPWGIDFLPDGRMVFSERGGRISLLSNGQRRTAAELKVNETGEGGLLGIAVDPQFNENRSVFVYYTSGNANRVSRFTLSGDSLSGESVILDSIPGARFHNGGSLRFGPDGKLYIATGDALQERLAQDRDSLAGKILRINRDGSVPEDNPFGNAVWAYGIRNCGAMDWSDAGILYAANHGPSRRDSILHIQRGGNYGWPQTCDQRGDFIPALRCYTDMTLAPGGLAVSGNLFVAGLAGEEIRRFEISGSELRNEQVVLSGMGRLRTIVEHDGWFYAATSNRDGRGDPKAGDDRIFRFRP